MNRGYSASWSTVYIFLYWRFGWKNVLDRGDSSGWIRGEMMERSMGCSCGLSALRLPHWNSPTPAHATSLGRNDWIVSKPSRLFSISSGVEDNTFLRDPDRRVDATKSDGCVVIGSRGPGIQDNLIDRRAWDGPCTLEEWRLQ